MNMPAFMARQRLRPSPEIESLCKLSSVEEVRGELGRVASSFGKTSAIMSLPEKAGDGDDQFGFLVCFEKTADALAASQKWRCVLFGFTTVVVFVKLGCSAQTEV